MIRRARKQKDLNAFFAIGFERSLTAASWKAAFRKPLFRWPAFFKGRTVKHLSLKMGAWRKSR